MPRAFTISLSSTREIVGDMPGVKDWTLKRKDGFDC